MIAQNVYLYVCMVCIRWYFSSLALFMVWPNIKPDQWCGQNLLCNHYVIRIYFTSYLTSLWGCHVAHFEIVFGGCPLHQHPLVFACSWLLVYFTYLPCKFCDTHADTYSQINLLLYASGICVLMPIVSTWYQWTVPTDGYLQLFPLLTSSTSSLVPSCLYLSVNWL